MTSIELSTPLQFLLLHELRSAKTGTDLAQKLGERKGSGMLTPGTIYPTLKELHKKRLVRYTSSGRSKTYVLSKKGEAELEVLYKQFSQLFKGMRHLIAPARGYK
ncbi:MAG: PadR family transcriptional regulator [Candidatus Woesearchaeota archaeon]